MARATWSVFAVTAGCSPTRLELAVELDDRVLQAPDPVHLDRHDVAGLDRPGVRGRPGQEDVTGLEGDQAGDVGDLVGEGEEQIAARVPFLDELAVHVGADSEVVGVDLVGIDEHGPERAEAVLTLDPEHRAAVGVPEVVDAPVVGDRVAADVAKRVVARRRRGSAPR